MHNAPSILQMTYDEKQIALALCVRVVESVSLKPGTVRRISEQAIDQFAIALQHAPAGGVQSDIPVQGRDSFWLDGERVAPENLRAARPVVIRQLNQSMSHSKVPQRELAHMLEFQLTSSCTPEEMASTLSPENRSRLRSLASGQAWEAWIECAAILLQLDRYIERPNVGMMLGNANKEKISRFLVAGGIGRFQMGLKLSSGRWRMVTSPLLIPSRLMHSREWVIL